MAQIWDRHCNQKAYGMTTGGADNLQEVEFKSGKRITYLKNSITKKEHDLKFEFNDSQTDPTKLIEGKTEYQWFMYWLEVTLRNLTESFYFTDIINRQGQKEYKIKSWPNSRGQEWKQVTLTFVEV